MVFLLRLEPAPSFNFISLNSCNCTFYSFPLEFFFLRAGIYLLGLTLTGLFLVFFSSPLSSCSSLMMRSSPLLSSFLGVE